jgi:23S rRNA (uracil1939-C5)-methyltransferase
MTTLKSSSAESSNLEPRTSNPPCPHFGPCGGCQLQNLAYSAQLAGKAAQLRDLLGATNLALPELQLHPSPPLAYRNRIRLTLAEINGQLRAGYLANLQPATDNLQPAFLPITECPIAAPILWRAAEALLALINQRSNTWLERAPFTLDQLELFTAPEAAPAESQLQISLYVRTSARHLPARFAAEFTSLCESLRVEIPGLAGAGIYLLPPRSNRSRRVEQPRPGPTFGTPGLNYTVAQDEVVILSGAKNPRISPLPLPVSQPATDNLQPATYWVPRGAFFQVNRFLLPQLLALATEGRAGELAWDLYAGVGLFTRALAQHFARVTAVEIAEPSFTALASTKLPNRRAVKDTTLDFLRSAVLQRDRPDLIVLDPPRTGAGPEVCELLARIAAPTLIYVSCSPETLPADLVTLAAAGYAINQLHLLDLFPQTTHIETVAVLTRGQEVH